MADRPPPPPGFNIPASQWQQRQAAPAQGAPAQGNRPPPPPGFDRQPNNTFDPMRSEVVELPGGELLYRNRDGDGVLRSIPNSARFGDMPDLPLYAGPRPQFYPPAPQPGPEITGNELTRGRRPGDTSVPGDRPGEWFTEPKTDPTMTRPGRELGPPRDRFDWMFTEGYHDQPSMTPTQRRDLTQARDQREWEITDPGLPTSIAAGLGQAFFSAGDEIAAAAKSLFTGRSYQDELAREQKLVEQAYRHHPIGTNVATIAGGFALPMGAAKLGMTLIGRGVNAATRIGAGALEGATYGLAHDIGAGQGSIPQRMENIGPGTYLGAALGGAIPGVGALRRGLGSLMPRNRPAPGYAPAARNQAATAEGIPLTEGQLTGNARQLGREAEMELGLRGEAARNTLNDFRTQQGQAIRQRGDQIGDQLAPGRPYPGGDLEVGETIRQGAITRANQLQQQGRAAYQRADAAGATVLPQALRTLPTDMREGLARTGFMFDPASQPTAFRALQELDNLGARAKPGTGHGPLSTPGPQQGNVIPFGVPLREVEKVRQGLVSAVPVNPSDATALGHVRRTFDDWLGQTFDNGLFSGSPQALADYKTGRDFIRQFYSMTQPKGGDDAGAVIARMVNQDRNGQEVANWLYGASIARPPGVASRVAGRLRTTFGTNSPEWATIRQGAWLRVMNEANDPKALARTIRDFTSGQGRPLAQTLYSPAEIQAMQRFADAVEMAAVKGKPGRGPNWASRALRMAANPLITALGFATGGVTGAVTGAVSQAAATGAAKGLFNPAAAQRAVTPGKSIFLPAAQRGRRFDRLGVGIAAPMLPYVAGGER